MEIGHYGSQGYSTVLTGDRPAHIPARGRLVWLKEGPTLVSPALPALQAVRQGSEISFV